MALFVIYSYEVKPLEGKPNLLSAQRADDGAMKIGNKSPEQIFENLFPSANLSMQIETAEIVTSGVGKDKISTLVGEPYGNKILQHLGQIIVLRIQANRTKKIENPDWSQYDQPHKPSGRIIIDARTGKQLILIEKKSDALSPTDAIDVLNRSLNRLLVDYNLELKLHEYKLRSKGFWNTVDLIKKVTNDTVRRVQFDFIKSKSKDSVDPMALATAIIPVEQADHGSISLEMDGDRDMEFMQRREDMEQMIGLCSQSGYNLTVSFRNCGIYRYGTDAVAQLGLEDGPIQSFVDAETSMDFSSDEGTFPLYNWLDHCFEIITKNGKREDGIPAPKKRKTKN